MNQNKLNWIELWHCKRLIKSIKKQKAWMGKVKQYIKQDEKELDKYLKRITEVE